MEKMRILSKKERRRLIENGNFRTLTPDEAREQQKKESAISYHWLMCRVYHTHFGNKACMTCNDCGHGRKMRKMKPWFYKNTFQGLR